MRWFRSRAVTRRRDGRFDLRLSEDVRELLRSLAAQMTDLLDSEPDDPSLRRLFPTAYPDDPFRDAEYQVMSGDRLRDGRRTSYEVLAATADQQDVSEDDLNALMRAVNDVRLVVGTRLDVSEEDEMLGLDADPDDPETQLRWLYEVLSFLEVEIVDALADAL